MQYAMDWLDKRAKFHPDKCALIDTISQRKITYKEWNNTCNQTAHFLRERLSVQKGDRITIIAHNCVEYLDLWMACNKIGCVLQNMNWRLSPLEWKALIQDVAPKAIFYGKEFADSIASIREDIPDVAHFISISQGGLPGDSELAARNVYPVEYKDRPDIFLDDPWVICYTGGTTGLPKGAILTQGNILWNAINTVISWGLDQKDVAILNAPLFHAGGMNVFTSPMVYVGGTSIVCKSFDVDQVFDFIERKECTIFFGVPTMFIMMQEHSRWEKMDFSHLKLVISGGAPCPLPVFEKFWAKNVDFKTGYGLTEAGPNNFYLPPEDVRRKPGAVGFPLMHIEMKIVSENQEEVTMPGVAGELLIRGPHRIPGYWNNTKATEDIIDKEGWLHTGDLAQRDEEGYYTISGRSKDMIISGGEKIYPSEVESVIFGHPCVAQAALIGIPDPKWGECGMAFVVLKEGAGIREEDIRQYCKERLAAYKVPKIVQFVPDLPKTSAGKIDKKKLRGLYSVG